MNISFRSPSLVYRSVYQILARDLRWHWRGIWLVAIISLAYEFHIRRIRLVYNLGGIDALLLILLNILILFGLGIIFLGFLETRSRRSHTAHLFQLRCELSGQLTSVKYWDDFASILFRFIAKHLSITGISLIVYHQILKKSEMVAEKFSINEPESSVLCLPLFNGSQQRAFLYLFLFPDIFYSPNKIDMIQGLAPEIILAIEHNDLMHSLAEKTQGIQKKEQYRIARHLHETIGQDLTYLCLRPDRLSSTECLDNTVTIHSEVVHLRSVANKAYQQIRSLLSELRADIHALSSSDLVTRVRECALLIRARANFKVNLRTDGKVPPAYMQRQVLYIIREALRNIEKHAQAQYVNLSFSWTNNGLAI